MTSRWNRQQSKDFTTEIICRAVLGTDIDKPSHEAGLYPTSKHRDTHAQHSEQMGDN